MENVNIKIPIPYIAAKWLWNLICLIAIGTCIYIYIYMQPLYSNLTKEKKEHSIYKDSVTSRIDVLITVIEHKNSTILKSEEKLEQLNQKVNLAYTKLAKNKEVLDNIYKLRDSLSNNKTEFTDEQRKIWLNNEFYLSPNASDSNK
jgi:hypothetical protein